MTDDAAEPRPKGRLYLEGARFTGGRVPVDALIEIQRYQELVLEAARNAWLEEHPDQSLPTNFDDAFRLTITNVGDGSAEVLLELERPASEPDEAAQPEDVTGQQGETAPEDFNARPALPDREVARLFLRGMRDLEAGLRAISRPETSFDHVPLLRSEALQSFGRSLGADEAVRVAAGDEPREEAPALTQEVRRDRLEPLGADLRAQDIKDRRRQKRLKAAHRNRTEWAPLAGRLVSLSPDKGEATGNSQQAQSEAIATESTPPLPASCSRRLTVQSLIHTFWLRLGSVTPADSGRPPRRFNAVRTSGALIG